MTRTAAAPATGRTTHAGAEGSAVRDRTGSAVAPQHLPHLVLRRRTRRARRLLLAARVTRSA